MVTAYGKINYKNMAFKHKIPKLFDYEPVFVRSKYLVDPVQVPLPHGLMKREPLRPDLPRVRRHFDWVTYCACASADWYGKSSGL